MQNIHIVVFVTYHPDSPNFRFQTNMFASNDIEKCYEWLRKEANDFIPVFEYEYVVKDGLVVQKDPCKDTHYWIQKIINYGKFTRNTRTNHRTYKERR